MFFILIFTSNLRELEQAKLFEDLVCPATAVWLYNCTENTMMERIISRAQTSGRSDDTTETIRKRIELFRDTISPIINHYNAKDLVRRLPAQGGVDEVFKFTYQQYLRTEIVGVNFRYLLPKAKEVSESQTVNFLAGDQMIPKTYIIEDLD